MFDASSTSPLEQNYGGELQLEAIAAPLPLVFLFPRERPWVVVSLSVTVEITGSPAPAGGVP